jgi:hypothetical protein
LSTASHPLAGERLRRLRLAGPPLERAADVVRWLVASQAQDFAGAKWALALRTPGATDAEVEREFDSGRFLRTHVMRPTWHFVCPEDVRWLVALTAPRVNAVNAHRYRSLELDASTFRKANAALVKALRGGRQLTRDELRVVLSRAGIGALDGQRLAHLLMRAELDAVVCSGARRGRRFTYALLEERAPRARTLSREEALAELAGRYFGSRGPASVQDFAKWSGLAAADARAGLDAVAPGLERRRVEGRTLWSGGSAPRARGKPAAAHLISIYDEYISSYRDRSAMCDPDHARRLVGMGAALGYLVLLDGRVAGTWKRAIATRSVEVEVTPFRRLTPDERRAVATAAGRFATFLGRELVLALPAGGGRTRRTR